MNKKYFIVLLMLMTISLSFTPHPIAADGFYVIPTVKKSGEITADKFIYSEDQQRFLSIPGNAFLPNSEGVLFERDGAFIKHPPAYPEVFYAPVYLPHGAKVMRISIYACVSSMGTITVELIEANLIATTSTTIKSVYKTCMDTCDLWHSTGSTLVTIDNENKTYYLKASGLQELDFPTNLGWVRIEYYVSEPLP